MGFRRTLLSMKIEGRSDIFLDVLRPSRFFLCSACLFLALAFIAPTSLQAEWYAGGFLGVASPTGLKFVTGTQSNAGLTLSNIALENSPIGGVKLGYYLPREWVYNILGFEGEVFHYSPDIKAQQIGTIQGGNLGVRNLTESSLGITTLGFNAILRYPGRWFQPYAGGGFAVSWASLSGGNLGSDTTVGAGPSVLAGARYFILEQLAVFAEYKHVTARLNFGDNVQLNTHFGIDAVVFGASWHF
jgi:opacity protein-like surface antigen